MIRGLKRESDKQDVKRSRHMMHQHKNSFFASIRICSRVLVQRDHISFAIRVRTSAIVLVLDTLVQGSRGEATVLQQSE
jgi:hypothetical protein